MHILNTISELREHLRPLRQQRIAFVPTMGNLHAGHISLVEHAHHIADHVVVSIFVNPLQFGPNEDFARYPRTLEADCAALEHTQVQPIIFHPTVDEMYPRSMEETTKVSVPELSELLCGVARPGHFTGVTTVVNRLLNIVQPDVALFGKKDFQQLMLIKRMVDDLCIPIEIIGMPTLRESDGLAMSSRNGYLSVEERNIAPRLYACLQELAAALKNGEKSFSELEAKTAQKLQEAGFKQPDYIAIRRAEDLAMPSTDDRRLVILAAAYLGARARLIDNLEISL